MGTINIRFRQGGLGNLPGVRQLDTSPLHAVAKQDLEGARALAGTADDIVQGGLRLGNAIVEMKAEDNRNEANKLYKDYVTYMDSLTTQAANPDDPNGGKEGLFLTAQRDDNAARNLANDLRKGQTDMRKAIGLDKQNARVKELFEEMAFSYDRGNALRADAIMAKRFHDSRTANAASVAELTRIQAAKLPAAENLDAYARALEDSFNARGLAEGERVLQRKAAQEGLLTSVLAERVKSGSLADTGELLESLAQDVLPPQAGVDERAHAFLQGTLKGLAPEAKAVLVKALETERDTLAGRQVDALVTAQYEGRTVYGDLARQRDAFRAAGVPESIVARANGVVEAQLQRDSNAAIRGLPDDVANAADPVVAEEQLDAYEATLPKHVREGAAWQAFRQQAKRVSPKTAAAVKKEAADERLTQIVNRWHYDENGVRTPVNLGQSEQLEAVALLWRTGQIDDAAYQDACNKINAAWDARTADLMRQATLANDFLDGFSYNWEDVQNGAEEINLAVLPNAFVFDKTGIDEGKTASNLLALFDTSDDSEQQRALRRSFVRERLHKAESAFAAAVVENPSWTPEQCRKLWRELMREPLYALGNTAFEMDPGQASKWAQSLGALWQAADPRADSMDYDPESILTAFQSIDLTIAPTEETGAPGPLDMAGTNPDQKPDAQPTGAQSNASSTQPAAPAPEGQGRAPAQEEKAETAQSGTEEAGIKPRDPSLRDKHPVGRLYEAEGGKRYIIPRGERMDLVQLAIRFGVPLETLRALNPDLPTDEDGTIRWGNTVKLPAEAAE